MSKVKFNAKHEYEYVANFKVLQSCFDKHNIENAIPVTRLIKCKFQDNLEFLQWIKKYFNIYSLKGIGISFIQVEAMMQSLDERPRIH